MTVPLRPRSVALRLLILSGLLALGGMGLLGIPGAAWLEASSPLARLFTDRRAAGDAMWPMAILHTLIWPWFLPLAYCLAAALRPAGRRVLPTLAGTGLGALALGVIFQLLGGSL